MATRREITELPHVAAAIAYETDVRHGKIAACRWIRLACERSSRERQCKATSAFPYRFDAVEAERVCTCLELFPHVKAPHAKTLRDAHGRPIRDRKGRVIWSSLRLEPWQVWITCNLFGWRHVDSGARRFSRGLILVPRKNGKTTWMAAIANYLLAADGEEGGEVYSAATTRQQARIVFKISKQMIRRAPEYRDYFGVLPQAHDIVIQETDSVYTPLSADAWTLDGLNPSGCVIDEFQAHKTRDVWDVLTTATGSRLQPLVIAIGTAGEDTGGICYEQMEYMQRVLDGTFSDDSMFGAVYTVDEGDDWKAEATWKKSNPNYGVSVRPDHLAAAARKAQNSPGSLAAFQMKHLNVWVHSASPWLALEDVDACLAPA